MKNRNYFLGGEGWFLIMSISSFILLIKEMTNALICLFILIYLAVEYNKLT